MSDGATYPHYSILLEWDDRDDIYVVTLPEWPGCHTHGETADQAVRHALEVIEMLVDSRQDDGRPLPQPRNFAAAELERDRFASVEGRSRT